MESAGRPYKKTAQKGGDERHGSDGPPLSRLLAGVMLLVI